MVTKKVECIAKYGAKKPVRKYRLKSDKSRLKGRLIIAPLRFECNKDDVYKCSQCEGHVQQASQQRCHGRACSDLLSASLSAVATYM
jgi:hypothetical protein